MKKIINLLVVLLSTFALCAATSTWTLAPGSAAASWSDSGNWDVAPLEDGTSDVVFIGDPDGNKTTTVRLNEDHAVNSLYVKQGNTTYGRVNFNGSGTLRIGAGGAIFTNFTGGAYSTTANSYSSIFTCPVAFTASQGWSYIFNGSSNSSDAWDLLFRGDWQSEPDVEIAIAGPANRLAFEEGSSAAFGGRVKVGLNVHFSGANQFSRLGTNRVMFSRSPLLGWPASTSRSMMFLFNDSSVGYLDSPLHFDFEDGDSFTFNMYANMINSAYDTELHIRGKWSGRLKSDTFKIEGPGDQYSSGLVWNATPAGQFRPQQCMIFFENDLSDLEFYSSESWKFKPVSGIIVIANPKAEKLTTSGTRLYTIGRGSRIRGILGGDGVTLNSGNVAQYCVHVADATGDMAGMAGGPVLVGAGAPGTCHYNNVNTRKTNATSLGETPLWFYSVTNGVAWFDTGLSADGSGSTQRALPLVVWGRGDTVFNFSWVSSGFGLAPVWVRGGRLRITKQTAASTWPIRVGAPVAGHMTVRAMQVNRLGNINTLTDSSIAFKSGTMPSPDGVALATGDRVCVNVPDMDYAKSGNATYYYNGIYVVDAENETWTRVSEFDEPSELVSDIRLDVLEGVKFGGKRFFLMNDAYRIAGRRGVAPYAGFKEIGFLEEMGVHPSCSLLTEGNVVLTNSVIITQNESTNRCEVGANVSGESGFSGPFSIERDFTLSAVAGGVCTFSGSFSGSAGLTKEGAGSVVLTDAIVSGGAFSVTNLTIAGGSLTIPSDALSDDLDRAVVKCVPGETATLSLDGDIDLSGWTFEISGLYKPAKDEPLPESFRFCVTSSDGGTLSGTPRFVLSGSDTRMWSVNKSDDGWVVSCSRLGMTVIIR